MKMVTFKLEKGTVIYIAHDKYGLPFELAEDTEILSPEANYKLLFSQSESDVFKPIHDEPPLSSATNNKSSESI
jgi:hypothetical protein